MPMPRPGSSETSSSGRGSPSFSSDQIQFLAYGRGLDARRMREVLGFEPAYTTRTAFEDYAQGVGRRRTAPHLRALRTRPGRGRACSDRSREPSLGP